MKTALIFLLTAAGLLAQVPSTTSGALAPVVLSTTIQSGLPDAYVTAGLFYNTYNIPHVSGYVSYGKHISGGTYSYTSIDVTSSSIRPFRPATSTTTGIAQHVTDFGKFNVFAMVAGGVSVASASTAASGTDVGFSGVTGFLLSTPVKNGWTLDLPIKIIASTTGPPQYVVGIGFGWGR